MSPSPSRHEYVAIARKREIVLINLAGREEKPCRSFARYKGLRGPICPCRPCADKYIGNRRALGENVVSMPVGWHPGLTHEEATALVREMATTV